MLHDRNTNGMEHGVMKGIETKEKTKGKKEEKGYAQLGN